MLVRAQNPTSNSDIDKIVSLNGDTPLIRAVRTKNRVKVDAVLDVLYRQKAVGDALRTQNEDGDTALIVASRDGSENIVQLLLDTATDDRVVVIEIKNNAGDTALRVAGKNGHSAVVKLLVADGASLGHWDLTGETPIMHICRRGDTDLLKYVLTNRDQTQESLVREELRDRVFEEQRKVSLLRIELKDRQEEHKREGITHLMWACRDGRIDMVEFLLREKKTIDQQDADGNTALRIACDEGHLGVVQLLLSEGASVSVPDKNGDTALIHACRTNQVDIAQALVTRVAPVDERDQNGKTALMWAAHKQSNDDVVRMLLDSGASMFLKDNKGDTALNYAIQEGNAGMVNILVERGAISAAAHYAGNAALKLACRMGRLEIVRSLLQKGVSMTSKDKNGETFSIWMNRHFKSTELKPVIVPGISPLTIDPVSSGHTTPIPKYHTPPQRGSLYKAGSNDELSLMTAHSSLSTMTTSNGVGTNGSTGHHRRGSYDINRQAITDLFRNIALREEVNNQQFNDKLLTACKVGDSSLVKRLLQRGASVHCKNEEGDRPLLIASREGHEVVVKVLLQEKAQIHQKNNHKQTALRVACENGHVRIVKLLLHHEGNSREMYDSRKDTATLQKREIDTTIIRPKLRALIGALDQPFGRKTMFLSRPDIENRVAHYKEISNLLLSTNAVIDAQNRKGETALMCACTTGNKALVALLLEHNASVVLKNKKNGDTPLIIASRLGHINIAELLVSKGSHLDDTNTNQDTALRCACIEGHVEIVRLLLDKGASMASTHPSEESSLVIAARNGHTEVVDLLLLKLEERKDQSALLGEGNDGADEGTAQEKYQQDSNLEQFIMMAPQYRMPSPMQNTDSPYESNSRQGTVALLDGDKSKDNYTMLATPTTGAVVSHDSYRMALDTSLNGSVDKSFRNLNVTSQLDFHMNDGLEGQMRRQTSSMESMGVVQKRTRRHRLLASFVKNNRDYDAVSPAEKEKQEVLQYALKFTCERGPRVNKTCACKTEQGETNCAQCERDAASQLAVIKLLLDQKIAPRVINSCLRYALERGKVNIARHILIHGIVKREVFDERGDSKRDPRLSLLLSTDVIDNAGTRSLVVPSQKQSSWMSRLMSQVFVSKNRRVVADENGFVDILDLLLVKTEARRFGWKKQQISEEDRAMNDKITSLVKYTLEQYGRRKDLFEACTHNNMKVIDALFDRNSYDINIQDQNGTYALALASKYGYLNIVKQLIEYGANLELTTETGLTALHIACQHGFQNMVELFLRYGAKLDTSDKYGNTPLISAIHNAKATEKGVDEDHYGSHQRVAEMLLQYSNQRHFKFKDRRNNIGYTALMVAVRDNKRALVRLLLENGASTNIQSKNGRTALIYAAEAGNEVFVKMLLDKGALGSLKDKETGRTALMQAVEKGHHQVLKHLLSLSLPQYRKSFVDIQDKKGDTALMLAVRAPREAGRTEETDMQTRKAVVQSLLRNFANVNITNKAGKSAKDMCTNLVIKKLLDDVKPLGPTTTTFPTYAPPAPLPINPLPNTSLDITATNPTKAGVAAAEPGLRSFVKKFLVEPKTRALSRPSSNPAMIASMPHSAALMSSIYFRDYLQRHQGGQFPHCWTCEVCKSAGNNSTLIAWDSSLKERSSFFHRTIFNLNENQRR